MSVSKWRVFICPYERVSVIHRFPKRREPKREVSANFTSSIHKRLTNQLKPSLHRQGNSQYEKHFMFTVSWDLNLWNNKNRTSALFIYSTNAY